MVEELASLGVRYVIGYGAAAAIIPSIPLGAQIAVESALIGDGTSRAYVSEASFVMAGSVLHDRLDRLTHRPLDVTAANIDALYRETPREIDRLREQGAEVVNLESAAFYAAAQANHVEALWVGHVSDRLLDDRWEDWFNAGREGMNLDYAAICLEIVREISATV